MTRTVVEQITQAGVQKLRFSGAAPGRYLTRAALAGAFIFVGALLSSLCAAWFYDANLPLAKLLGAYLALVVPGKLSAPWYLLLLRGVLCNFLVCIGVFAGFRLQSETAKALVIALAITTFVLTGLEHSIANMAYFALHALLNGGADWAAMGWNLLWVTLGNLLGGAVLLGLPLWYAAEPEKTQSFS